MRNILLGGTATAALFSATIASAQPAPTAPPKAHARGSFFTSNQNRGDVASHVERMFKGLDVNRDGFVTKAEISSLQTAFDDRMAKGAPKRAARMFDRLDTNHDGQISEAELDARRAARAAAKGKSIKPSRGRSTLLARADANKDGIVTRAEYDAATTSGRLKFRHANMRGSAIVRTFDVADANKDGRVSLEEAQRAALAQFDTADLNHDGVLTPEERRQVSKARRKKRAAG